MAGRPPRYPVSVRAASPDGRYWGRWPQGDRPVIYSDLRSRSSINGALSTQIRLGNSLTSRYGLTNSLTAPGGGGSNIVIFNPGNLGQYSTDNDIFTIDTNTYGSAASGSQLQSGVTRPGGSSKCIQISYGADDDGTELIFPAFAPTKTLYYRWSMMLGSEWSGHFPVGLKTTRTFTQSDWSAIVGEPGIDGQSYASPKLWMRYPTDNGFNPDYPAMGVENDDKIWGTCIATMNLDIGAHFDPATLFNNGLSHVRAGYWYMMEIYQTMNSANGVADGSFEWRIDGRPVYVNNAVKWIDSSRYVVYGLNGWQSMWFGGNASYGGGGGFTPPPFTTPFHRWEDDYYVSTQPQWLP